MDLQEQARAQLRENWLKGWDFIILIPVICIAILLIAPKGETEREQLADNAKVIFEIVEKYLQGYCNNATNLVSHLKSITDKIHSPEVDKKYPS